MHRNIRRHRPPPLCLALQGGGAHGAFTWGVLERLLEAPDLRIEAISATSSGAMNACALAQGWAQDGPAGARRALTAFWQAPSRRQMLAHWWTTATGRLDRGTPWLPGPLPANPLRGLVEEFFDPRLLREGPIRLHLAATRVRDGALTVFSGEHLDHDALLASACLPQWFPAVEIGGEAYWDGGLAGNPALEPLLHRARARDLLCVLLQPPSRPPPPPHGPDIAEHAAQLSFAASFQRELRDLEQNRAALGWRAWLSRWGRRLRRLRLHTISPPSALTARHGHSALDTRPHPLGQLHSLGREAADAWCDGRFDGHASASTVEGLREEEPAQPA